MKKDYQFLIGQRFSVAEGIFVVQSLTNQDEHTYVQAQPSQEGDIVLSEPGSGGTRFKLNEVIQALLFGLVAESRRAGRTVLLSSHNLTEVERVCDRVAIVRKGELVELDVKVGDTISAGDTVCIIEAMKLFNEIESEVSGKIVEILVDDSTPVEYDQVLFRVQPA